MTLPKVASQLVYDLIHLGFRLAAWLLLRQELKGLENIPRDGPYLMVVNHLAVADPAMIFLHFPRKMVMFAADKWKDYPFIGWLANTVGVVWVARGEADREAIKLCLNVLKTDRILGMAPEGTRSRTGALQPGKTGAAYLADRAGVPIVPVGVVGMQNLLPNIKRLRRTRVQMVVGRPFRLPANGRAKGETLKQYTDEIMCRIAALIPAAYRGAYADHPLLSQLSEAVPD